jgi:hypothetical protein
MRSRAFEVKAVAGFQAVIPLVVKPDFKFAAQDVKEFFTFVGVGFAAAAAGLDTEEVRFHGGVAPGEKLHADIGAGFKDFTPLVSNMERMLVL